MDLISRKAAIEAAQIPDGECSNREERYGIIYARVEARRRIREIPSVPAVPLDKLCEWLERYATMDCDGCREAFGSCEDEENQEVSVCNSRERWKAMLTKWMEEQDAAD